MNWRTVSLMSIGHSDLPDFSPRGEHANRPARIGVFLRGLERAGAPEEQLDLPLLSGADLDGEPPSRPEEAGRFLDDARVDRHSERPRVERLARLAFQEVRA